MLITSMRRKRWILPKGVVEKGNTPIQTGQIEAFEEAGLRGKILEPAIGHYTYRKWGGSCVVDLFLMEVSAVEEHWPEKQLRERKWVSMGEIERWIDSRIPPTLVRRAQVVVMERIANRPAD
jgi:8-oxo-dGTP pyrophosphatase MutT (NUDIX family)